MAIMGECPVCHRKQAVRNKVCVCGLLDKTLDKEPEQKNA